MPFLISIALLSLSYLLYTLYTALSTPFFNIPNAHWSAPYSRLWLLSLKYRGKEHKTRYRMHLELGDVIRLAPWELSVNCIDNGVMTVYGSDWDKGAWYESMRNFGYKYLFSLIKENDHKEHRAMLIPSFSEARILQLPALDKILDTLLFERLLPQMRDWRATDRTVNVLRKTKAFCMDVTSAYCFGLGNGTNFIEDRDQRDLLVSAFESNTKELFWLKEMPAVVSKILVMLGLGLRSQKHIRALQKFEEEVSWECKAAKENASLSRKFEPESKTVYAQFRRALEANPTIREEDIDGLIEAEMWSLLLAGHEGPGITLAYLMFELHNNTAAQAELNKEIRSIPPAVNGRLPAGEEIEDLPYLDAVVRETMRVHPSALGPFPRVIPSSNIFGGEDGARIGDFAYVPPGTTVSTSVYSLHRNPQIFPNPDKWEPERWLNEEVPRKEMEKWWWAFGSGSRSCIGDHLSFRMMKAFVVAVYADFEPYLISEVKEQIDGIVGAPGGNEVLMKFFQAV